MAKHEHKTNPRVIQIFADLEAFKKFCREYGYVYNEAHLGDMNSFSFRQFAKSQRGGQPRNMWAEDAARFEEMQRRQEMF